MTEPIFEHGGESERIVAEEFAHVPDERMYQVQQGRGDAARMFWDDNDAEWAYRAARELERRQIERGKQV